MPSFTNQAMIFGWALSLMAAPGAAADRQNIDTLPLGRLVDTLSLRDLADIVVTDTKVEQRRESVTQQIVVLRRDDLDRLPVNNRNLAEWSSHFSGSFVNVLSRNDANWGSWAGLGPKYNSFLLNGLPIDSFVDAMSIDPAAIERVEVHKGPASVLYSNYLSMDFVGNETPLAGTTNFVLKNRVDTPLTRFSVGAGSYGTWNGTLYRQGRESDFSYVVGASSEHSDYTQVGLAGSWLQTTKSPSYQKTKVFGNFALALGRPDHTLAVFLQDTRHTGTLGRPFRDYEHRYDTLNLTYDNALSQRWRLQFKLGERFYDRQYANDDFPAGLALTNVERTHQIIRPMDLTFSYLHGEGSVLTFGADRQTVHYWVASRDATGVVARNNDATARSVGYFVQEKWQWNDWVLRAGWRHNAIHHDYARLGGWVPGTREAEWSKNLWSVGARYRWTPELSLFANVGTSFLAPSAKQIGGTVPIPTASGELANPALQPESGLGRDFGIEWHSGRAWTASVRIFDNRVSNAIVSSIVSVTPSQTRSENAGRATATGLEVDLNATFSDRLAGFANAALTRTRLANQLVPDESGTTTPFAPDRIVNVGLLTTLPTQTRVSSYFRWVGRYYDSASRSGRVAYGRYGMLNMRIQQPLAYGAELVVDLINVGNRRPLIPFSFRDPGFSGMISLGLAF